MGNFRLFDSQQRYDSCLIGPPHGLQLFNIPGAAHFWIRLKMYWSAFIDTDLCTDVWCHQCDSLGALWLAASRANLSLTTQPDKRIWVKWCIFGGAEKEKPQPKICLTVKSSYIWKRVSYVKMHSLYKLHEQGYYLSSGFTHMLTNGFPGL